MFAVWNPSWAGDLFTRKARVLELTEAGANYLPVVREAFDLIRTGTQAFVGVDRGRHLVLQCNMAFSVFWLAPRLHRLYARHPWIVLNVVTPIWDPERHAALASLEIRFGRQRDMSQDARKLTQGQVFSGLRPRLPGGRPNLDTATLFDCAGVASNWNAWYRGQGKSFNRGKDVNLASTFVISIAGALEGACVTMAHDSLVSGLISEGRLVRASEHSEDMVEGYFLLPAAEHEHKSAANRFLEWLDDEIMNQRPT